MANVRPTTDRRESMFPSSSHPYPLVLFTPLLLVGCDRGGEAEEIRLASDAITAQVERCELKEAVKAADALIEAHGASPVGWQHKAEIALSRWETDEAWELYLQAFGRSEGSYPQLDELVQATVLAPGSKVKVLAIFDEYRARNLDDRYLLTARFVPLTRALTLEAPQAQDASPEQLAMLLVPFDDQPCEASADCYRQSEALLLLERWAEARAVLERGIAKGDDPWEQLIMHKTLAFLLLHQGEEERARELFRSYLDAFADWGACHFAVLMPLPEYVALTSRAWLAEPLVVPERIEQTRQRARDQGVGGQYAVEENLATCQGLLAALEAGDSANAHARLDDLEVLLGRDYGCTSETVVARPHMVATVQLLRADLLAAEGDLDRARAQLEAALTLFPEDPVLTGRLEALGSSN